MKRFSLLVMAGLASVLSIASAAAQDGDSDDKGGWVEPDLDRDPVAIRKDDPALACICEANDDPAPIILHGLVTGARTILGPDRRSVEDRMATIFNIQWSSDRFVRGEVMVWHLTAPKNCGVTFDYGRSYKFGARETEDGEIETDACLAPRNGE